MERRTNYFLKQKLMGVVMILVSLVVSALIAEAACIMLVTIPMGILLIFTKHMVLVDSYYRDMEERGEIY